MKFAEPEYLWILLAAMPAAAALFYWSWRVKQKLIGQFIRARLLPNLTVGVSPGRQIFRLVLTAAGLAGVLLALARPQWGFAWEEAKQRGLDIIVAIDTSRSMLAKDVAPNRLERAKLAAFDLMRQARTDRLGLVAFAGTAFLQSPLTLDDQAFRQGVDALTVGIIPQGGTALSAAIRTSLAAFEKNNDNNNVMVLFTDGEDHDADTETLGAAKEAAAAGMHIYTIGVGTKNGELLRVKDEQGNESFIKDEDGNVVKSSLNEKLLRQIATEAGGFYLPLQGPDPMAILYKNIAAQLPKTEATTRLARVYRERYYWPLALAVICLLVEFLMPESSRARRSESSSATSRATLQKAVAALFFLLTALNTQASPSSAFRDYQSGDYKSAFDEYNRLVQVKTNDYRLHYDTGVAAYKVGKMAVAQEQFNAALNTPEIISDPQNQQRTYYNLGNTLYHLGEPQQDQEKKQEMWEQAIENYARAIKLKTNDVDARSNLAFVQKRLEELKKQQQQQDNNKQNDQEPSEAAKQAKARADEAVKHRQYREALDIMEASLKSDQTTQYYGDYIKRLQEVNGVAVAPAHQP